MGALIIFATAHFFDEWLGFWFWFLPLPGGAMAYLGGYGGLSRKMGMQPPFTNDPLGWRQAKSTYTPEDIKRDAGKPPT